MTELLLLANLLVVDCVLMIVPYARSALGWRDVCTDDLTRTWRIICDVPCTDHRVFCYTTCLVMVAVDVPFLMIFHILIADGDIS